MFYLNANYFRFRWFTIGLYMVFSKYTKSVNIDTYMSSKNVKIYSLVGNTKMIQ